MICLHLAYSVLGTHFSYIYLTFISLAYLSRNHENNITTNTTYNTTLLLLTYPPKLKEIIYVKCLEKGQA